MTKGRTIANAQSPFVTKHEHKTETRAELDAFIDFKMSIVDDFFDKKNKLKASDRKALRKAMQNIKTIWGIDRYFQEFIFSHQ